MAVIRQGSFEVISRSPEQTRRVGMRLGALLKTGDVIALEGELGSGKTTFMQGIASGWGSLDPVSSPTFVLVNVYRKWEAEQLFHLDAYRLNSAWEAYDLDLEMMLSRGPLVVEWADRIREVLPDDHLWVQMKWIAEEQRDFMFQAHGERFSNLLNTFKREVYGVL